MKKLFIYIGVLLQLQVLAQNFAQYVNPFIGTGGHGHTFPGAVLPFGMVQLSPDTRIDGSWDGCGGYHYSDSVIYGFSHTHLSGTGVSDWGDILLMPTIGVPSLDNKIYSSKFYHKNENASAGYYSVKLEDGNIKAELTSTIRVGIHRYSFPKTEKANIVLDLLHRDKTLDCSFSIVDSTTVIGYRVSEAWAKKQNIYFAIKFSKPIKKSGVSINKTLKDKPTASDKPDGAYFNFNVADGQPLIVKVALSNVDEKGALQNLQTEAPLWDFAHYKNEAEKIWNQELKKIEVIDDDVNKLSVFYTSLYHCMIHPSINSDVDGKYRGRDDKIHEALNYNHYNVFSLWDTYRALHPLLTIIDKKRTKDFLQTFMANYREAGRLPVWELSSNETECMIGYHSVPVIVDAFLKGICIPDTLELFNAIKSASNYTAFGQPIYIQNGFLSIDDESESVSKTLEYAYDDWCIAQMARKLKKQEDFKNYTIRAQSYKNLYDANSGFMRPRKNGGWLEPFSPAEVNNHYTEANSWQYSFYVPQDISGLISLHGSDSAFEKKLDHLFTASSTTTGREQADITGLIGQYAHGNEPSHHMAYLYNYVGKPAKTIDYTRKILNQFYKNSPDGLIGNEDCGQMSAWYVFSSIGFYPVTPAADHYAFSLPFFQQIKLTLENGKTFTINTNKTTLKNGETIKAIKINDNIHYRSFLPHSYIEAGSKITFIVDNKSDSVKYGENTKHRPHTRITHFPIVPSPIIRAKSKSFTDSLTITLEPQSENQRTVYTDNGKEPNRTLNTYKHSFSITKTCTIKAKTYAYKDSSKITTAYFYKKPHQWKVLLKSNYNPQYTAGGADGIVDGIYGDVNWRKGEWQGFQGQDFEAIIDLQKETQFNQISANFLQDTRPWILFPKNVEFLISNDGTSYKSVGIIENDVPADNYDAQLKKFTVTLPQAQTAKYVKIKAKNFGKLPDWHLGAGGEAFIFIDEIEVK